MTLGALILAAALSIPLPTSSDSLGPVDMGTKRVTVNVKIDSDEATAGWRENMPEVTGKVQDFYRSYGIEVELRYADHLPVGHDVVDLLVVPQHKRPDERFVGRARYEDRSIAVLAYNSDRYTAKVVHGLAIAEWWQTVAHEMGHLFGLYHTGVLKDDEITDSTGGVFNLMYHESPEREEFWRVTLVPLQVRQLHSYLSKGTVYVLLESIAEERPANGVIREYDQRVRDSAR